MYQIVKSFSLSVFVMGLFFLGNITLGVAQGGPAVPAGTTSAQMGGAQAAEQPGIFGMLVPFLLMFVVLYFLMIRPQQKKMKEHQQLVSELKQGDEIITNAGILGKVTGLTEKVATVEIADNVRIKILRNQISQVVKGPLKDQL
jgi:preprotein translocase subunit YajC